jgi:hypothetical protein
MHLHHPSLSLNGKKKGKQKFRNAEEARRARELDEEWQNLLKKWGADQREKRRKKAMEAPALVVPTPFYRGSDQPKIPSLPFTGGPCAKPESKVYTGTKVKGIGTMHKSNAVPIFSDEEAVDIAKMRR